MFNEDISYRKIFVENINTYRGNGIHEISNNLYEKISPILNMIIDKVFDNKDYMTLRYCIILSQTFFKIENEKKIYLQKTLEKNKLFLNLSFWDEYISCIII